MAHQLTGVSTATRIGVVLALLLLLLPGSTVKLFHLRKTAVRVAGSGRCVPHAQGSVGRRPAAPRCRQLGGGRPPSIAVPPARRSRSAHRHCYGGKARC